MDAVQYIGMLESATMERKKRTVISIQEVQPEFDFEEAAHFPSFTFPEYQRDIIGHRLAAGAIDFGIVGLIYVVFVIVTFLQMPSGAPVIDKRILGIYGAGYLLLVAIYLFLFMLSGSQTPGMKLRNLIVVTRDDNPLELRDSCLRGFGYLISILPLMLGFMWAVIDPEHLTWTDKVSGTFVRRI
jgi:uncharacterized RDD family membrane protein YckC